MTKQLYVTRTQVAGQSSRSMLGRRKNDALTYSTVGMSLGRVEAPDGYRDVETSRTVGRGEEAYRRVGHALMNWEVFTRAGHFVQCETDAVVRGATVVTAMPTGPISITAPCRIVDVVAEGTKIGFAYGTLPGHPARGEESFILEHRSDDSVVLTIRSISQLAGFWSKLGGPISHSAQSRATRAYLSAAEQIARG